MVYTLIILDKKRQVRGIISRIDKLKENFIIICIDKEASKILKEKGIPHKTIDDYISSKNIEKKVFEWLNTLSEKKIDNKKNIKELLNYDGISLWNFIAPSLYAGFFYYPLADIIKYVNLVSEVIDKEKPKRIIFVDDGSLLSDIIVSAIEKEDILKIKISDIKGRVKEKIIKKIKRVLIILVLCRSLLRKTYWAFLRFHEKTKTEKGAILLFSGDQFRSFYDLTTKEKISGDPYYEYIFNALHRRGMNMTFVGVFTEDSILGLDVMKKRVSERDLRYIYQPFEGYITKKGILTAINITKRLTEEFKHQCKKNEFKKALNYRDISLYGIIYPLLLFYVSKYLINLLIMYEAGRNMLEKEDPSIVVVPESAVEVRCIASVAKKLNIPSLGIQHGAGALSPSSPTYNTNDADMFPDITVVGGDHWKNMVVNNSKLSSDRVLVAGMPRYDILAKADEIFNKQRFYERYDLDPKRKIVLIITENLPIFEDNVIFLENVLKSTKRIHDIQIVIKPHPGEKSKWYNKIVKKQNIRALLLSKSSDTYEAIYVCDLMIAFYSTTIIEAMILGKPVITVNLTGKPDPISYAESGAAIGVYKEDNLVPAIKNALYNEEVQKKLAEARKKFVYEYAYIQDGKASERVVNLIIKTIEESKRCGG